MARRRSRRRSSGGQRAFCPVIRIKCSRKFSRAQTSEGPSSQSVKFAKFKSAKQKLLKKFRMAGLGNVHPQAESTSLPPSAKAAAVKIAHASANEAKCTVSMGGKSWKLKGAAAGKKVASLIHQLKAGGCCAPKVVR